MAEDQEFDTSDVVDLELFGKEVRLWLPHRNDHIQKIIRETGLFYELELLLHSMVNLSTGDHVVDVGANIGNHSIFWAVLCGCKVLAIEPNPKAHRILSKNIELNGVEHLVTLSRSAAGAATSRATLLEGSEENLGQARVSLSDDGDIDVVNTDQLIQSLGSPVKLIKVDVEGYEHEVLSGAGKTIETDRPSVYCEAATPELRAGLELLMRDKGYIALRRFNFTPTYYFVHPDGVDLTRVIVESSEGVIGSAERKIEECFRQIYRELYKSRSDISAQIGNVSDGQSKASKQSRQLADTLSSLRKSLESDLRELSAATSALPEIAADVKEEVRRSASEQEGKINAEIRRAASEQGEWINARSDAAFGELSSAMLDLKEVGEEQWKQVRAELSDLGDEVRDISRRHDDSQAEKKRLDWKLRRVQAQRDQHLNAADAVRASVSYQLGNAIVNLVRKPGRGIVEFPRRLIAIFSRRRKARPSSRRSERAERVRSEPAADSAGPDALATESCPQQLSPQRFRTRSQVFLNDASGGFNGWTPNQDVRFDGNGRVRIHQDFSTPGIKRTADVKAFLVYKLSIDALWELNHGRPVVRVEDPDRQMPLCAAYEPPRAGPFTVYFQTLSETSRVTISLLVDGPATSDGITVRKVSLEEVEDLGLQGLGEEYRIDPQLPVVASVASIPSRERELRDCVHSLLPQVDELRIFLNGYRHTPAYLSEMSGVKVFRSQEYGDQGDAGKFFGVESTRSEYLFTCDDDIIYPLDYVTRMLQALSIAGEEVIVGVHGVLLKQPFDRYYDERSRYVLRHVAGLDAPQYVHVLGTGTVVMRTDKCRISELLFQYPNMADIWLARHSQEQSIPLLAIDRARSWLRQNDYPNEDRANPAEPGSIYEASTAGGEGALNTGLIQTRVLKQVAPISVPLSHERHGVVKAVMSVTTYNREDYLREFIESFWRTCDKSIQWVLIVADDGSTDGTLEYLDELKLPLEVHVIRNRRRYAVGQTNTIFDLAKQIGFDVGFKADDDVVFVESGWDRKYIEAIRETGYHHLCYLNVDHFLELRVKENPSFSVEPEVDRTGLLNAYCSVENCMGAFFTFTEDMLEEIGGADEENFPIRGQWHIDLSARACRAGFNSSRSFYDVSGSNELIKLQNNLREDYQCSIEWNEDYQRTKDPAEMARRAAIIQDSSRIKVVPRTRSQDLRSVPGRIGLNDVVEKAFVLNLQRRPDRLELFNERASSAGIEVERFEAVDGSKPAVRSEWENYFSQPMAECPEKAALVRGSKDYYLGEHCERARVAFLEQKLGRKAIQSPGAWGYLQTMKRLLQKAIEEDYESIAVFDDDAVFHKEFREEFDRIYRRVPPRWSLLQLGTLQYHWDDEWIEWVDDSLYLGFGTGLASHALVIDRSLFPLMLWHCERLELPFDEGALHYAHKAHPRSCYTFYPNLVIQDVSESDINSSGVQEKEGVKESNAYRWRLSDYWQ